MHTFLMLAMFRLLCLPGADNDFLTEQKTHDRVRTAYAEKESTLTVALAPFHLDLSDLNILIVTYKSEKELVIYGKKRSDDAYQKLFTYPICKSSGVPGPKRKMGDLQVPEGFYHIAIYNPESSYYLSLGLNYPNQSDSLKSTAPYLGGDIYIHGDCVTVGCMPMSDDKIKEIYVMALQAHAGGQSDIPVYSFPFKFTEANVAAFTAQYKDNAELLGFWKNLRIGYDLFHASLKELTVTVGEHGEYMFH